MRNIHKSILGILGTHLHDLSATFETFGCYILLDHSKFLQGLEKWGAMEPLLSLRNIQKIVLCQCLCASNAVCCVVAKGPDASLASSDVEGIVST